MSRSVKHTPIVPNAGGETEKPFKQQWHRAKRRKEHVLDHQMATNEAINEDTVETHVPPNGVVNPYLGPKDGKGYVGQLVKAPVFKTGAKGRKMPVVKENKSLLYK